MITLGKGAFIGIANKEKIRQGRKLLCLKASNITMHYKPDQAIYTDSDTTTSDYVVNDTILSSDSGITYICIADSTAGALLTDTTYFVEDTRNDILITTDGGLEVSLEDNKDLLSISSDVNICMV